MSAVLNHLSFEIQNPANASWIPMTGDLTRLEFARGNSPTGLVDDLEIGNLASTLRGPAFAPATNPLIRPRARLRVRGHDGTTWRTIWTGVAGVPVTTYDEKNVPVTNLPGIDVIGIGAETKLATNMGSGTFNSRLGASLTSRAGAIAVARDLIGADDTGANTFTLPAAGLTRLERWTIIVASLNGWLWAARDRTNTAYNAPFRLNARSSVNPPGSTPVATFSDTYADTGYHYTGIEVGHDAANHINAINYRLLVDHGTVTAGDYGTYVDTNSTDTWPRREASFDVTDINGAGVEVAATRLLRRAPLPTVVPTAVTHDVLRDRSILTDDLIYQPFRVKHAGAGLNGVYLIAREHHVITRERWQLRHSLRTPPSNRSVNIVRD